MSHLEHQIRIKPGAKLKKNDSSKCQGHEQLERHLAAGDRKQTGAPALRRLNGEVGCDKVTSLKAPQHKKEPISDPQSMSIAQHSQILKKKKKVEKKKKNLHSEIYCDSISIKYPE